MQLIIVCKPNSRNHHEPLLHARAASTEHDEYVWNNKQQAHLCESQQTSSKLQ